MARFEVSGVDGAGKKIRGIVEADSEDAARTRAARKYTVHSVRPVTSSAPAIAAAPSPAAIATAVVAPSPPVAAPSKLILCPSCDSPISRAAASCPKCGHPMNPANPLAYAAPSIGGSGDSPVQAIEKTGKKWKLQRLLAGLLTLLGIFIFVIGIASRGASGNSHEGSGIVAAGGLMIVAGIGWGIFSRMGAWWHHG
jgi:hypothetical protein